MVDSRIFERCTKSAPSTMVHLSPFIVFNMTAADDHGHFFLFFRRFFSQQGGRFCVGWREWPNRSKMSKPLKVDEDMAGYYGVKWVRGMRLCRECADDYRKRKVCRDMMALDGSEIGHCFYSPL